MESYLPPQAEQDREQDNADTVVEQGLAFHFDAQQLGDVNPFHTGRRT
jgi:hypothetical protein